MNNLDVVHAGGRAPISTVAEIGNIRAVAVVAGERDVLRELAERLPRPLRFLGVGGLGLVTDIGVFTLALMNGVHPLAARVISLAIATLVTWRLNRALTFDRSGHYQGEEAMRYLVVTATAQSTSYAIFAVLAMTVLRTLPQAAIVIGAAAGALISYNGRLFAFAPGKLGLKRHPS